MRRVRAFFALASFVVLASVSHAARAGENEDAFARGTAALAAQKPQDAIVELEALRDRGVEDAAVSFDLGLAYVARAKLRESPGDLGHAVHAFEEAKALTKSDSMRAECTRMTGEVRAIVAKRRARIGLATDMEESPPPSRALAALLSENGWSMLALFASCAIAIALAMRWKGQGRVRVAGGIVLATSVLLSVVAAYSALVRARMRESLEEGIVVADEVRPSDEKHIILADAPSLAAGQRVTIEDRRAGWARVRAHKIESWIPERSVLSLPRER